MAGGEDKDGLSKYATSLDFTHSHVVQIFIKGPTVFLWVFAAELVAGEGDAGRPASCLAVMQSCWQIGLGVLVPAGPLSWGFLSAVSSLKAVCKHQVPAFTGITQL